MNVAIVSDTHVPARIDRIPDWVRDRLRAADHVVHAGDFDSAEALSTVENLAGDLTAVSGNTDVGLGLPPVETVTLGGVEFVVTHGIGSPVGYQERVAETVREHAGFGPTVGVAGHTHRVLDTVIDGVRLLNPGSATGAPPATQVTMLTAAVERGEVTVTVHERDR
ncbi:metallophosphoesterase family protein [Halorientalis pallida]|uniref:Phosphoesterase n=1 Tax=Halorientalis pallida TaxID=2479928 RepID=A0A498KTA3_9EURY|nr:metallophosphoesterase family protein [Halorientalis pallida]RXK47335.1 metallophosphoesterase [Halorientalis pallida]